MCVEKFLLYLFSVSLNISYHHTIVISVGPPDETHGEVKGFSLVYSGNFLVETELSEMSRLRVNMGIHPMGLQWNLKRGG